MGKGKNKESKQTNVTSEEEKEESGKGKGREKWVDIEEKKFMEVSKNVKEKEKKELFNV